MIKKYKIMINREKCNGCAKCAQACNNFVIRNNKAYAKKIKVKHLGCNQKAMDVCPTKCIRIMIV